MNKTIATFLIRLIAFAILLSGIHYYIYYLFLPNIDLFFPLWTIYLFNAVLVFVVYSVIHYQVSKGNKESYRLFLMLTLGKMVIAVIFLLPLFSDKSAHPVLEVVNFFIPYFVFLAFEILSLNKFFQNRESK